MPLHTGLGGFMTFNWAHPFSDGNFVDEFNAAGCFLLCLSTDEIYANEWSYFLRNVIQSAQCGYNGQKITTIL